MSELLAPQNLPHTVKVDDLIFSSDINKLDIDYIHRQLREQYWAKNLARNQLQKSIQNSLCYGLYKNNKQIGFARVVTDYSQDAYLTDVFIESAFQKQGCGTLLIKLILESPITKDCFRWLLLTRDAHALYKKFGFSSSDLAMFRKTAHHY